MRRAAHDVRRRARQSRDPNFIGFDKYARFGAYHWNELANSPDYAAKVSAVLGFIGPGDTCVDLGCGDGAVIGAVAPACQTVVGVDADFDAVRLARQMLAESGRTNVQCLQLPIGRATRQALGLPNGADVVYSLDVIEHLPDPDELLRVASDLVATSGTVIIGTPLFLGDDLVSPYHVREFGRDEIAYLLRQRFDLDKELILPMRRLDGVTHQDGFFVGICSPR